MLPAPSSPLWLDRIVVGGIVFLILFSPLAFGSVHPWAFALMEAMIFLLVVGWMGWLVVAGSREQGGDRGQRATHFEFRNSNSEISYSPSLHAHGSMLVAKRLALPLALFFVLILFQLLPLPPSLLRLISPSTFELYTQSLPGWPSDAPYASLSEVRGQTSEGGSSEQGAGSKEQSAIRNPQVAIHNPQPSQPPTPVILPTLEEVRAGAPIPEFGEQRAASREQREGGKGQSAASQKSEVGSHRWEINSQSEKLSGSMLRALSSTLPQTWIPLSLAPSRTRSDLLKIVSYAVLFFIVLLYPFGESRGRRSEVRGQRSEKVISQFAIRNPQFDRSSQSAIRNSQSSPLHTSFTRRMLLVVISSGLLVAVIAFVQRFSWNGMILWFFVPYDWGSAAPGNDPRASGPFVNPDHLANYLALIFPLAVGTAIHSRYVFYVFRKELVGGVRIFAGLAAFLIFSAVLLSLSRSGWIAMLLGTSVLLWLSPTSRGQKSEISNSKSAIRNPKYVTRISFIILSVLLIVSLFFVGPSGREQVDIRLGATVTEDAGLWGRTSIWSDTLKMIRDFPLMGVGLGSWQDLFQRYQSPPWRGDFYREAHNDYIELLSETGIIGFILLACFFWLGGKSLWSFLQSSADRRSKALVAMLASALGVMAFHEFFDFSLQIPANAFLFTILFAMAVRIAAGSMGQGAWSQEQGAKAKETFRNSQFAIRNSQLAISRFLAPCSMLLAVLLFFAALSQEMVPYPYNVKMPGSVAEAREMILAHPALSTPHLYLVHLLENRAPLEWQVNELRAALWLNPTNPNLRDLYAGALLRAGKKEEGLREISRSILNAPSFSNHAYLNGRFLQWLSTDEKNALEQGFKEAIGLSYPGAMDGLASLYSATGRFADEAKLLEETAAQATEGKHKADLSVRAAMSYLKAGDPKGAESLLRNVISIAPDDPRPYHTLAVLIYADQKQIDKANKIISEGIKNGAPSFELHLALAEAMKVAGDTERSETALKMAEEAVQSVAARNGKEPYRLYVSLADTAQRLELREKARSALARALDLYPSSSEVLNRLAQLHLQDRNFDRAAYYFRSIINLNPKASDAYYHLAVAEEGQYRFAAASEAYTRAIELAPDNKSFQSRYEELKRRIDQSRKEVLTK